MEATTSAYKGHEITKGERAAYMSHAAANRRNNRPVICWKIDGRGAFATRTAARRFVDEVMEAVKA